LDDIPKKEVSPDLMLDFPYHCWAQLAGISGEEKSYLGSNILIINYPALSAAIGGRYWMDGSRTNWMTLPIWEVFQIRQILMDLVDFKYSWNSRVSFCAMTTKVEPLDSH
jgi:hypothetical protein